MSEEEKVLWWRMEKVEKRLEELEKKISDLGQNCQTCYHKSSMMCFSCYDMNLYIEKSKEEPKEKEISFGQLQKNIDKNLKDAADKWKQSKEKEETKNIAKLREEFRNTPTMIKERDKLKEEIEKLQKERNIPCEGCFKITDLKKEMEKLQNQCIGCKAHEIYTLLEPVSAEDVADFRILEKEMEKLQMDLKIENTNYESVTNSFNILLKIHKEAIEFAKENIPIPRVRNGMIEILEKGGKN